MHDPSDHKTTLITQSGNITTHQVQMVWIRYTGIIGFDQQNVQVHKYV